MQNKTELVGVSVREKLAQVLKNNQKWVFALLSAMGGYIMAGSSVFGGISPFGVAFCAAVQGPNAIAAALGAVIGYTFSPAVTANMKYVAAVFLVAAAKWLFAGIGKKFFAGRQTFAAVLCAFVSLALASLAIIATMQFSVYDMAYAFAEVLLACGAAYFFTRSLLCLRTGRISLGRVDLSCIVISFALVVVGLSGIAISGLSLGHMLCVLAILFCARYYGEAGGAICGITAGIAMSLAGGNMTYLIAAYSFGGLIAGVLGNMSRVAAAASFILINASIAFMTMETQDIYTAALEVFVASVIFMVIPSSWVARLHPDFAAKRPQDAFTQELLQERFSEISGVLAEIGTATRKVGESLRKMDAADPLDVVGKVTERICKNCEMKTACWQMYYNDTMQAMSQTVLQLKKSGRISHETAPPQLKRVCCKLEDLLAELNGQFQSFASQKGTQHKISRVRSVVTDQFEGMSLMMQEISGELCGIRMVDEQKRKRILDYFEKEGLHPKKVQALIDGDGRKTVQLLLPNYQSSRLHKTKATLDLCEILDAEFDLPQITACEQGTVALFMEKPAFSIELGAYQIASEGSRLCGDAYDYIRNKAGRAHFILSDGMGSGGNAAVDSSMASGLLTRLLAVGIGHEAALKLVNSALIIKSGEESLATVDVATIDLFTGHADFYKAGAAPTYLLKSGKAGYFESTSLPAGILRGVTFEHSGIALRENDVIVMVSDGVTVTGTDWVNAELENMRGGDMQRLCEKLAKIAKARRSDNREDDITVMAVALRACAG